MKEKTFAVVGGDMRYAHLAGSLAARESDCRVYALFMEGDVKLSGRVQKSGDIRLVLPQSDVIIFPLPLLDSKGYVNAPFWEGEVTLEECLDYISPGSVVLAGKVSDDSAQLACKKNIQIIDYLEREELAVLNAVPTAEGAVQIALEEMPTTLYGSNCMITGFGRVAKVLARLLVSFGAKVWVVARKYSDLAWIKVYGCTPVHIRQVGDHLGGMNLLFNTVPAMILEEEMLLKLKRSCLVIDLASKPGGVDFDTARALGLKTIWALSLPGKVAPISAADIILDTIYNILNERGTL